MKERRQARNIYSTQSSKNLFAETSEACFARFGIIFKK